MVATCPVTAPFARRWRGAALLGLLALASACKTAPPTPDAKEVDSLKIEGTKQLSEKAVKQKLVTGESSWLPWWVPLLGRLEWYDGAIWQADLRRVTRFYESNGYYQAKVLDEQVTDTTPGHVKLVVKVSEGQPARITSLDVRGLDALAPEHRVKVLADLPLRVGAVFLEEGWQQAKVQLAARLRELGYVEVVVTAEAVVDADAASVAATVDVTPGTRYRFGGIFVATDPGAQVPPKYIAEQAAADLPKGDWYSESALAEAQARVFQLGVFGAVKVNRAAPDHEDGSVPIVIDVREAPFRTERLGFGFSADNVRQEIRLVGEYTHRNLGLARLFSKNTLLDRLTVKGKLGVAFLPTLASVLCTTTGGCLPGLSANASSQWGPIGQMLTEYEVPRIFGQRTLSLQTSLNLSRALEPAYDYWGAELKLGVGWRPTINFAVYPSLNFDAYLLNSEINPGANAPAAAIGCPRLPAACLISYLEVVTEWDRRDNKLEPRMGFYTALSVQVGLSQTTQLTPYTRLQPEVRGYWSFGKDKRWTLAGRLRAGTLLAPRNDTPIIARFFSGGSAMRGFSQRRLSPLVALPGSKQQLRVDENGAPVLDSKGHQVFDTVPDYANGQTLPIGGSGLFEASVELRWNLWDNLVLAVFVDSGMVTAQPLGLGDVGFFFTAVGVGARYRTPLGPIRLDIAYRLPIGLPLLDPASTNVTYPVNGGCFFKLGYNQNPIYAGSPDSVCTWHLSIGEAF